MFNRSKCINKPETDKPYHVAERPANQHIKLMQSGMQGMAMEKESKFIALNPAMALSWTRSARNEVF